MRQPNLFDIWEDMDDIGPFPYRVQMVNYVVHLPSRMAAERLVESTKKARAQESKANFMLAQTVRQGRKS